MKWRVRAPSNIALIKYMGKTDASRNLPSNPSVSLTLSSLCTTAEIEQTDRTGLSEWDSSQPTCEPPAGRTYQPLSLDQKAVDRALTHVERVRARATEILSPFDIRVNARHGLKVRTANTFPAKSGLASSASSFAALTLGTLYALSEDAGLFVASWKKNQKLRSSVSKLSREGSGSSCRSFDGPWVGWADEDAKTFMSQEQIKLGALSDIVVIVDAGEKSIGSSEAHKRVAVSPIWNGRVDRTHQRWKNLEVGLKEGDLSKVAAVAWEELWEMHSLFHTASPPFTYWLPESVAVLRWLEAEGAGTKVIATMDAGPNVHVLVPTLDESAWKIKIEKAFPTLKVLVDRQGQGAEILET